MNDNKYRGGVRNEVLSRDENTITLQVTLYGDTYEDYKKLDQLIRDNNDCDQVLDLMLDYELTYSNDVLWCNDFLHLRDILHNLKAALR